MTSEVALLNRSAVALAADSAMTVRHWEKDHYEAVYFKGTNKIFQMSAAHPVGIMVYAAASLQRAPWDVLIKSYREHLGSKAHDQLQHYALDLFDYITNNAHIFSPDIQEEQFKSDVDIVAVRIIVPVVHGDAYKGAPDVAAKSAVVTAALADARTNIENADFVGNATQADVDATLARYTAVVKEMLENDDYYSAFRDTTDFEELAKLAIIGQYKAGFTNLSSSGIVIAGYGDTDYFPRLVAYRCYGLVLGKLLIEEEPAKAQTISQTNSSAYVSFAKDDMIQTFIYGTGASALSELDRQVGVALDEFHDALVKAGLAEDVAADAAKKKLLDKLKIEANEGFVKGYVDYSFQSHARPMRRALSSLPFDELAELAETLVLLESLKERVTSGSASVSGPVDVAVISKNDGFIWIKRKHYFDPKLNPRYFTKRGIKGG